jgi:hypothetical protein
VLRAQDRILRAAENARDPDLEYLEPEPAFLTSLGDREAEIPEGCLHAG